MWQKRDGDSVSAPHFGHAIKSVPFPTIMDFERSAGTINPTPAAIPIPAPV